MRTKDRELARKLISLRKDISDFRLEKSVAETREIIEEAMEVEDETALEEAKHVNNTQNKAVAEQIYQSVRDK